MRPMVFCVLACACGSSWEVPARESSAYAVVIEPEGVPEAAPPVLRLRVRGALGSSPLADFRIFEGELSAYHLGRIAARELPKTLVEREVPVLVWGEAPDIVVAPLRALELGRFSLATPELGLVAQFDVG